MDSEGFARSHHLASNTTKKGFFQEECQLTCQVVKPQMRPAASHMQERGYGLCEKGKCKKTFCIRAYFGLI